MAFWGPGFSLYISQDIKGNAGCHRLHCCGLPSAGANLCVPVAHSLPSLDMRTMCVCVVGRVGRTTVWPLCSVLCGLSAAGRYSNTHSLHIIVKETKRQADVKDWKRHTHTVMNRHSTWALVCSWTISIATAWANRLWQCFAGDWLGGTGNIQLQPSMVGTKNTKKDSRVALLSIHTTTHSAGGWKVSGRKKEPPFSLESEQKSFSPHYCTVLFQCITPNVCVKTVRMFMEC